MNGRNVRQRVDRESGSLELVGLLKGVRTNIEQFRDHEEVFLYLDDTNIISDELLLDASRAVVGEWSTRHTDTKRVEYGSSSGAGGGVHEAGMTTFEWAMGCQHPSKRFDLWDKLHGNVTEDALAVTPKLVSLVAKKTKYMLYCLFLALRRRGLIVGSLDEERDADRLWEGHVTRVIEIVSSCQQICVAEMRVHINLPDRDSDGTSFLLFDAVGLEQRMTRSIILPPQQGDPEINSFQSLHAYLLDILRRRGYRKWNGMLYEPIRLHNSWTGAWKLAYTNMTSDFSTFLTESISRHLDWQAYVDATSSTKNREEMIKQLAREEEPECPTLVFNRLFISFRNAIVHTCGAVFPLSCPEQWQDIADRKNAEWTHFAQACARRWEALGVYVNAFDLSAHHMRETGEDMCIRPPCYDDATIKFIDEDVDESLFDLRFDGTNFDVGGVTEDDPLADVEDLAEPWDSPLFTYLDEVSTKDFDEVQLTQNFSRATRFWDLATMGRGLFPGKTLDNAQYFPFHQGRAGTGKSLKLQVLQSYFPEERLGVLSSKKGEETFWSMGMQHKWALFWLEVQNKEAPIDRGTFQQMVGYELVSLPQKGSEAVMKEWDAPIFAAGNEYFSYEDSSGSMRRRTMTFLYKEKPPQRDTEKLQKIKMQRAPLLLKMLHSYHLSLMLFPGMDWERTVPMNDKTLRPIIGTQLHTFHRLAIEALDPLQGFVSQTPNVFDFGPGLMMPEAKFIEEYNVYRKDRLQIHKAKWSEQHYQLVFENMNIHRDTADVQDPSTGVYKSTAVLIGIAPKDAE